MRKAALLPALLLGLLASGCVVQPVGSVAVDTPDASVRIGVRAYPELALVPGTPVYYAPWVDQNYFFYDGMYWVFEGDNWYASYWFNGPWSYVRVDYVPVYILRVPVYYYRRPPVYFRNWRAGDPPRWDERWGPDWEQRHPDWRRHDSAVPAPAPRPDYQRRYSGKRYPSPSQQQQLREQNYSYRPREHVELVPGSRPAGAPSSPQRLEHEEQWQQRQDTLQRRREEQWQDREDRRQERQEQRQDRLPGMRPDGRQPGDGGNGPGDAGRQSRDAGHDQMEQWRQQRDSERQAQWPQRPDAPVRGGGVQRPDPDASATDSQRPDARGDRDEQQRRQAQWEEWQGRRRGPQEQEAAPEERQGPQRQPGFSSPAGDDPRARRDSQWASPQERQPSRPDSRGDGVRFGMPGIAPGDTGAAPSRRELPAAPAIAVPERSAPATTGTPAPESRPVRKEAPARKPARLAPDKEHAPDDTHGH